MMKLFMAWSASIITMLATANYQGYSATSLFSGPQSADKSVNHWHK